MLEKQTSESKEMTNLTKATRTSWPWQLPCQELGLVCSHKLQSWGPAQQDKPSMETYPVGHHSSSFSCVQSMRNAEKKCLSKC